MRFHHAACVYPCAFSTVVHARYGQRDHRCRQGRCDTPDRAPELGLQSCRIRLDPRKAGAVALRIEQDPLFEVITEQSSQLGRIFSRQQVGAHVLGADRISLRLFVILALIVTRDSH